MEVDKRLSTSGCTCPGSNLGSTTFSVLKLVPNCGASIDISSDVTVRCGPAQNADANLSDQGVDPGCTDDSTCVAVADTYCADEDEDTEGDGEADGEGGGEGEGNRGGDEDRGEDPTADEDLDDDGTGAGVGVGTDDGTVSSTGSVPERKYSRITESVDGSQLGSSAIVPVLNLGFQGDKAASNAESAGW